MTLEHLKAWCATNGATFTTYPMSGGLVVLNVQTSDMQSWRTAFKPGDDVVEAARREAAKARALLDLLEHKYPKHLRR